MEDLTLKIESIIDVSNDYGLASEILLEAFNLLKGNPYYSIEYCLDVAFDNVFQVE